MITILNLIPRWVMAFAIAILVGLISMLSVRLSSTQAELLREQSKSINFKIAIEQANTQAANQAAEYRNQVIEAQNDAKKREISLRAVAAAASSESNGLRDDLATMRMQLDQSTRDAIIERANSIGSVLAECSREYQGLAEVADRHASDVKTLTEAWPKATEVGHNIK